MHPEPKQVLADGCSAHLYLLHVQTPVAEDLPAQTGACAPHLLSPDGLPAAGWCGDDAIVLQATSSSSSSSISGTNDELRTRQFEGRNGSSKEGGRKSTA
jgi:hypothetical protein